MKNFVFGFFLLLLMGCSTNRFEQRSPVDYKINQNTEISENDAIVIGRFADTGPLTFCFYELSSRYLLEFSAEDSWQIKNIPEGTYWLGMIKRRNKNTCPTVWHDLKMYFDVKHGEIVYIGDFNFDEQKLSHTYNNSDLNKFMKHKKKSLKNQVKTRYLRHTD